MTVVCIIPNETKRGKPLAVFCRVAMHSDKGKNIIQQNVDTFNTVSTFYALVILDEIGIDIIITLVIRDTSLTIVC